MSRVWQGSIASVYWPHRDQSLVDLPIEMWSISDIGAIPRLEGVALSFDKYVSIKDVPLWAICGPEMAIMTRDMSSKDFFCEFAAIDNIALRLAVKRDGNLKPPFSQILLFKVSDSNSSVKIAARPVNINVTFPRRINTAGLNSYKTDTVKFAPSEFTVTQNEDQKGTSAKSSAPLPVPVPVPDVKRSIQQTIMGALRLRGIRSSSPNFKKLYFSVLYIVENSLEKVENNAIDLHTIHDKVETILSVID